MEYKRICPECGKEIIYKSKGAMNNANKINSLCHSCAEFKIYSNKRYGDLSILLNDDYETFYWIGFLLADGSFSDVRLRFGLSEKDKEHVEKFAKFIKYKQDIKIGYTKLKDKQFGFCSLSIQDKIIVPQIINKFDIKQTKTYNPPHSINKWNRKLILALFAGFIDGDGSIIKKTNRKDAKLGIKIHSSWLHILEEFSNIIFNKNYCGINKEGYAYLAIEEFPILRKLKLELLNLHIPLLERKWNNIDENYINKYERGQILRPLIKQDFNNGMLRKDICKKYNVSGGFLTKILKYEK